MAGTCHDIRFHKLGENIIWVNYNHGEKSFLEFFSTEPLDVLIKKKELFHCQQTAT